MTVFVDTSAFYAVLDRGDENHTAARETWLRLLQEEDTLLTTSYVLLETCALLQNRLGIQALRAFHENVAPLLRVEWISGDRHKSGVEAVLAASRKHLSVVDCIAFQTMRENAVHTAFCFDRHYADQGFSVIP
jgi:predicted nucleic acid-binding protein